MKNRNISHFIQEAFFEEGRRFKIKSDRAGTFIDNMKLPIHRWFRYSAGFSAQWVEQLIRKEKAKKSEITVLDPFAGSGTTMLAADLLSVKSIGVDAHPFVSRIAKIKLLWATSILDFQEKIIAITKRAKEINGSIHGYPKLINKCYLDDTLISLDRLKEAWFLENSGNSADELVWLLITSILRPTSTAGTAQWQYILPNKNKKRTIETVEAFNRQARSMEIDMRYFQSISDHSKAMFIEGDIRQYPHIPKSSVDMVITSPPYANNYDYADATRLEMSFWGEISSWGDLHNSARKYLICSSSQHASKEKYSLDILLESEHLEPIRKDISAVCRKLEKERLKHVGKKHYHTMIAAYFEDMALGWKTLRKVCKDDSTICFIIGDSAPYGIYVPVDKWLGELAIASGFRSYRFEKLRDRNIKWKNRKHRVPLHEGMLWVNG